MKLENIKNENDFDLFVVELGAMNLPADEDYELYNQAFEKVYGHPAFDE